jgi:hypothetical protein
VERLYEEPSKAGQSPRYEANHGSIYQRLAARTHPLVIFAHPPVLVDPRNSPFHYPPTRQYQKAFGGLSNGTIFDLFAPGAIPAYGFNDGIVFGFRVNDIEAPTDASTGSTSRSSPGSFELDCPLVRCQSRRSKTS